MSALDELLAKQLIAAASAETAPITARIWGGIPTEDLAAGRVLARVTERADAELAALTARPSDRADRGPAGTPAGGG